MTALSFGPFAGLAQAQVPRSAAEATVAVSTEAALPASTSEPTLFQTQEPQLGGAGPASTDQGGASDFMHRYKPQANLWEVGAFIGPLFISDENSFRSATVVTPGRPPAVKPISSFRQPALELGIRGGYYPLTFLGGELEGMLAVPETDSDQGVTVLAARAQVVVQSPFWSLVPFLVGGVGYWNVQNDVSGNDADPAFHYGGGAKLNVTDNLAVRLDIRDTITNQRGGGSYPHNVEALAGANLVFGRQPVAAEDADRDGVSDGSDQCPLEAGTLPSGCPIRDSDADGILDPDDQCAMAAGVPPTGCPTTDADQDGVLDAEDQCANEKGGLPTGCPDGDLDGFLDRDDKCPALAGVAPDGCLADPDGDGILAPVDKCPDQPETKNGFEDADGCADELPSAVQSFMGVIAGIEFDNAQAVIRPSSEVYLEKAASILEEFPSLRIEIIGHTDGKGARDYNLGLSQQRAEAVKQHLVAQGIEQSRILSKGEGPDVPLATNDTAEGRQKNRRIEFRVIQ
jgi:outer membrane protein OmpA-like peptidoglycan-associated protein